VTETIAALERERKGLQVRVSELEDQNRQLKTIPTPPTPAKEKKTALEEFFEG